MFSKIFSLSGCHLLKDSVPTSVWELFYTSPYEGNKYNYQKNPSVILKSNEVFVYLFFNNLTTCSIGIAADNVKFLHSLCAFENCSNYYHGGAIYFKCKSSIIQHRFCTSNAIVTNNEGFHSNTQFISESDLSSVIVESSITKCIQPKLQRVESAHYETIGIYSSNISKNTADVFSALLYHAYLPG